MKEHLKSCAGCGRKLNMTVAVKSKDPRIPYHFCSPGVRDCRDRFDSFQMPVNAKDQAGRIFGPDREAPATYADGSEHVGCGGRFMPTMFDLVDACNKCGEGRA